MEPQEWIELIRKWKKSGLNQAEFCRREGVRWNQFHYWRKKLMEPSDPKDSKLQLVEVKVTESPQENVPTEPYELNRGLWNLKIPADFEANNLMVVMRLMTVCK